MRLIPRDEKFYDSFSEIASRVTASASLISQLFAEPRRLDEIVAQIKTVEHEADGLTHEVISRINKSFVTPFDREDIHLLVTNLDNVVDLLDGTARRAAMFHITEVQEPAKRLADVILRASDCIEAAVKGMKDPKVVAGRARDIKRLEEEGDAVYQEAVGGLFAGAPDAIEVLKWKEMYDTLERTLDQCEDVANVLESIAIKNA